MTSWLQAKNNASSVLAVAFTSIDTSLSVKAGEGARFPSVFPFHITIDNEILECTDRVADVLTITRAQEGTTAASHLANAPVRLNITAAIIAQLQAEEDGKIAKALVDAKGDIIAAAADNNPSRFPIGTEGQILRARLAEAAGLKWEDLPSGGAYISSGAYTGNSTANRAIPHGLGNTPKVVFIQNQTDTSSLVFYVLFPSFGYIFAFTLGSGTWYSESSISNLTVTQMDSTNFYVGHAGAYPNTANNNGKVYRWVALF